LISKIYHSRIKLLNINILLVKSSYVFLQLILLCKIWLSKEPLRMISNLICCVILHRLCTYGMLNKIVNPSNDLCIVCFPNIYQSSITLISFLRFHKCSTNISPYLFTLTKIFHLITLIWIIFSIQPHIYILKWVVFFSSYNQQIKKNIMQEKGKRNSKL